MTAYDVWATRYDDPHKVELIPARGLSFNLPLSDHGQCTFTATVEPGQSLWRPALTPPFSGILVTRDNVPVWSGWLRSDRENGARSFSFTANEWGSFFTTTPAYVATWTLVNDHSIFRDLVNNAQSISGQNVQVTTTTTAGAATSDLTINVWENLSTEDAFRRVGNAAGGPEWYFGTSGTIDNPTRPLILGDRLGALAPIDTLMFVEDSQAWAGYDPPPSITLLSGIFPAGTTVPTLGRRGGNVLESVRTRDTSASATVAIATGDGVDAAQLRQSAEATTLLSRGWPRMTRWGSYSTVKEPPTLLRHAQADLAASAGIATGYNLVTLDGDPDWTQVPRGSTMRVILDTDRYASNRPLQVDARLLNLKVDVPDDGGTAQVQWDLADVLEAG